MVVDDDSRDGFRESAGNHGADLHYGTQYSELYICTGVVLVQAYAPSDFDFRIVPVEKGWGGGDLVFLIPDAERTSVEDPSPCLVFWPGEVGSSIAPAAWVSSFGSLESDFGFAVDEVHAEWDSSSGVIEVTAKVATRHVVSEW